MGRRLTLATTTIFLVRHGESESNRDGIFAGRLDSPLTDRGREQARALHRRFAKIDIARVVTSDLKRAQETAALLVADRPITVEPDRRLREMHYGDWEGKTQQVLLDHFKDDWEALSRPTADFRAPGGESLAELRERVAAVYGEVVAAHPDATVILVAHGNAIGALLATLLDLPYHSSWRFQLANGGLSRVHHVDGTPVIVHVNDTSHLDGLS